MAFMGQKGGDNAEPLKKLESSKPPSSLEEKENVETVSSVNPAIEETAPADGVKEEIISSEDHQDTEDGIKMRVAEATNSIISDHSEVEFSSQQVPDEISESSVEQLKESNSFSHIQQEEKLEKGSSQNLGSEGVRVIYPVEQVEGDASSPNEYHDAADLREDLDGQKMQEQEALDRVSSEEVEDALTNDQAVTEAQEKAGKAEPPTSRSVTCDDSEKAEEYDKKQLPDIQNSNVDLDVVREAVPHENDEIVKAVEVHQQASNNETNIRKQRLSSQSNSPDIVDSVAELGRFKKEMKMMETALQGAARQAQELTAGRMIDSAKEKDELYYFDDGRNSSRQFQSEELSKKQAAQESQIRKLRALCISVLCVLDAVLTYFPLLFLTILLLCLKARLESLKTRTKE